MPRRRIPELQGPGGAPGGSIRRTIPSMTAAYEAVAKQLGLGRETVRRWVLQADIDAGGTAGDDLGRARGDQTSEGGEPAAAGGRGDPAGGHGFLRGRARLPQPLIMAFIDDRECRSCGRVDLSGAARAGLSGRRTDLSGLEARLPAGRGRAPSLMRWSSTRCWRPRHPGRPLRATEDDPSPAPSGHAVAFCTVDRLMRELGMNGVRRGKSGADHRPGQGRAPRRGPARPGLHAPRRPTGSGSRTSPTSAPGPGSSTSRSSWTSSPSGSWAGTPPTTKHTELVLTPLRIATVGARPQGPPRRCRRTGAPQRRRQPVHIDPVHRAPRPRRHRTLDRDASATPTTTP